MNRELERRLRVLEDRAAERGPSGTATARVASLERILAGTATRADYENAIPRLLQITSLRIESAALVYAADRALGEPIYRYRRSPEERDAYRAALDEVHNDCDADTRRRSNPQWWFEQLDASEGVEFDYITLHCSYFETQDPYPGLKTEVQRAAAGNDLPAKIRAHLYLTAVDDTEELRIRRDVERRAPGRLLHLEGEEGRTERMIAHDRHHCHGDLFDVRHDRLPASCYTAEGPPQCGCVRQPRAEDWITELYARDKRERDVYARRIGARPDVPNGPE